MSNKEELAGNYRIEEYKTLRQEILELDKRKNNLIVYTAIATATLIGFAVEFKSSFIFLAPNYCNNPFGLSSTFFAKVSNSQRNLHFCSYRK